MDDECGGVLRCSPKKARKRARNPDLWKKNVAKQSNLKSDGVQPKVSCAHARESFCKATLCSHGDIRSENKRLYDCATKVDQDAFLLSRMTIEAVKRGRGKENLRTRRWMASYFLLRQDGSRQRVCGKTFAVVFRVSQKRLQRIAEYYWKNGISRPENRGGKRAFPAVEAARHLIREHIESFRCTASHYGRDKVSIGSYSALR
jgi:hypothetical protein